MNLIKQKLMITEIKIVNTSDNEKPAYSTLNAAGMDIRANLTKDIFIKPMERILIPTGLFIELPVGMEAQIRPRSGLAFKKGITILNTPGTIDSDYRGEIKVILINLSNKEAIIKNGERICQIIISRHEKVNWKVVKELEKTERGQGGFGHTGIK